MTGKIKSVLDPAIGHRIVLTAISFLVKRLGKNVLHIITCCTATTAYQAATALTLHLCMSGSEYTLFSVL